MSEYQPCLIKAYLRCGVVSDAALPLDGALFYQANRARWGTQDLTVPGGSPYRQEHGNLLPIKRVHQHPYWYYHCSFAQWPAEVAEGRDHWNKRFDASLIELLDAAKRIPISGGRYKSYHMPIYYRHALAVSWYALAKPDELRGLLGMVTHLGKKTDQGWGRVLRWEVEPAPTDWSIYGPAGQLMRPIPSPGGVLMGYRPPYWQPENQTTCRL